MTSGTNGEPCTKATACISQQVDQIVQEEWKAKPGIGNKDLLDKVQAKLETPTDLGILKTYIKVAKSSLLYSYKESNIESTVTIDAKFVQRKLQERQSLRAERRFEEADHIAGVQLNLFSLI